MPVDWSRYPPNWKSEVVPRIRARSGDKCEWCGVINKAWIVRPPAGAGFSAGAFFYVTGPDDCCFGVRPVKVILTTAHLGIPLSWENIMEKVKQCAHCKSLKPHEEFSPDRKMKSGLASWCKECSRARNAEWYKAGGKETSLLATRRWRERNPDQVRRQHRDWVSNNKDQRRAQQRVAYKRWKDANPDIVAAHRLVNKARGRVLLKDGVFTRREWLTLCQEYGGLCACCRASEKLTPDHIVPVSFGGCNHIENIQPLCLPCNLKKGTKIIYYKAKHDKMDTRDENLAHLCQRCHLLFDLEDHLRNARVTRKEKKREMGFLEMDL